MFVTLFELVKTKRSTHQSWWGKWEGNHFVNNGSCLSLPLKMALVYTIMSVNWVFSWSPWWPTFMSHVTPLTFSKECIVHCRIVCLSRLVMLPSLFVVPPNVQRGFEEVLPLQSTQSLCQYIWVSHMVTTFASFQNYVLSFMSSMWDSSWPSFDETILVDISLSSGK